MLLVMNSTDLGIVILSWSYSVSNERKSSSFDRVDLPICMGHEMSGTIVECGPGVKGQWKEGDRVVV